MSPCGLTALHGDIRAVWLTTLEGCLKTAVFAEGTFYYGEAVNGTPAAGLIDAVVVSETAGVGAGGSTAKCTFGKEDLSAAVSVAGLSAEAASATAVAGAGVW